MPILEIEIVLRPEETTPPDLAARLADAAGAVFGTGPGRSWVRLRFLPANQYAENGAGLEAGLYPVFVSVLHAHRPSGPTLTQEISALTTAVARLCNRPPANVHILYQPDGAGRIAFGGKLK